MKERPGVIDMSGICYLCWQACDPHRFREHIPPKGCFPEGITNLVTVCCCEKCNKANTRNDEFFRLAMSLAANPSISGAEVFDRAVKRTIERGRLKKEIAALRALTRDHWVDGKKYAKTGLPARQIRLQLIRITKGFIRHFYPEVDYRDFEWDIIQIDQFRLLKTAQEMIGEMYYHERGDGAHRLFFGIAEDNMTGGLWFHLFHDGQGFGVIHRKRDRNSFRPNVGIHFD